MITSSDLEQSRVFAPVEQRRKALEPEARALNVSFYRAQFKTGDITGAADAIRDARSSEYLQKAIDEISADTTISAEEVSKAVGQMVSVVSKSATAIAEDIEKAYGLSLAGLREDSSPFNSKDAREAMQSVIAARSAMGGTDKMSRADILQEIAEGIANDDIGLMSFYRRYGRQILNRASTTIGEKRDNSRAIQDLENASIERMSTAQRNAYDRLNSLQENWKAQRMDTALGTAQGAIGSDGILRNAHKMIPRGRTEKEIHAAQSRQSARLAEAME